MSGPNYNWMVIRVQAKDNFLRFVSYSVAFPSLYRNIAYGGLYDTRKEAIKVASETTSVPILLSNHLVYTYQTIMKRVEVDRDYVP